MATRLIGTDTADPRLPAVVIAATQGTTSSDLAPGDVLADANAYTDEVAAEIIAGGVSFADDAQTIAGTADNLAVTPVGLGATLPFTVVVPSGADDTAAIQAAITATAAGGTVYFHEGTYTTTGPITSGNVNVVMPGASEVVYTGTGTAWTVAPPTTSDCLDVTLRVRRSAIEWDTGVDTTSAGVVILNCNFSRFRLSASNFHDGVVLRGDATGTCYNIVDLVRVDNNKRCLVCDSVTTGWVNQNEFHGRLRISSGRASYVGTRLIDMSEGANGNTFVGVSLEGVWQERTFVISAAHNLFLNCRFEANPAGSCEFTSTAISNLVIGGYQNWDATTMFADPSGHNHIIGTMGGRRYTDGANGNPRGDEHRTNGLNVIAKTFLGELGGVMDIYADITGAGTISTYNKKGTDATPLVQIAGAGAGGRGVWFSAGGAGSAGASGRIYGHNAGALGVVGHLYWATDNVSDIGAAGSNRPRNIFTAGRIQIAGALDHDGTTVGFYNTTPIAKPAVAGSRGGNAALASLLTQLAALGLITDSSTA